MEAALKALLWIAGSGVAVLAAFFLLQERLLYLPQRASVEELMAAAPAALRAWPSAFGGTARLALIAVGGIVVLIPFTAWEALAWLPTRWSWQAVGLVLAAALLPGAAAYGAYAYMQRVLGAARVGVVLYLGPLYSALIGWLVLGERIEPFHGVGALLLLPGIWLSTRR